MVRRNVAYSALQIIWSIYVEPNFFISLVSNVAGKTIISNQFIYGNEISNHVYGTVKIILCTLIIGSMHILLHVFVTAEFFN